MALQRLRSTAAAWMRRCSCNVFAWHGTGTAATRQRHGCGFSEARQLHGSGTAATRHRHGIGTAAAQQRHGSGKPVARHRHDNGATMAFHRHVTTRGVRIVPAVAVARGSTFFAAQLPPVAAAPWPTREPAITPGQPSKQPTSYPSLHSVRGGVCGGDSVAATFGAL